MPDQGGGDLFGLATERFVKRRDTVGVRGVDVGTVGDEELDSGGVRVGGGPVEEGVAAGASVDRIGVDAARELGIYSQHFKSFQKYLGDTCCAPCPVCEAVLHTRRSTCSTLDIATACTVESTKTCRMAGSTASRRRSPLVGPDADGSAPMRRSNLQFYVEFELIFGIHKLAIENYIQVVHKL